MKDESYNNKTETYIKGRVSAVVPVYNGEKHLANMLDSILEQTWPQVELILVDDGSSDGTVAVAEGYRENFAARGYGYRI
ncbi:glycosyltransferase family A protein, partial [Bacteroides congonensis]|uniref:glycosyltransferase family 2 protein n=1 Tax=Bacteroides congonensis TaxID=1871006 RepID=UPI00321C39DA